MIKIDKIIITCSQFTIDWRIKKIAAEAYRLAFTVVSVSIVWALMDETKTE